MTYSPNWPGNVTPVHVAAEALVEIKAERPQTKERTHEIVDAVIARYPGCAATIVRSHVEIGLTRPKFTPKPEQTPRERALQKSRALLS